SPGGHLLARWSGWEPMALQDVADGLIADGIAQISQGAGHAIITPGAVLLRHAHYYGFQLLVDTRATWSLPPLGAAELFFHDRAVHSNDDMSRDNRRDF